MGRKKKTKLFRAFLKDAKTTMRNILSSLVLLWVTTGLGATETGLDRYVAKPDPTYQYEIYDSERTLLYRTDFIRLTSQQWRSPNEVDRPVWEHQIVLAVPAIRYSPSPRTALLLINGGSNTATPPRETSTLMQSLMAATGGVVVDLGQIPNEPLTFADEPGHPRKEDALVAYSFDKFINTGDETWPIYGPMVKATVRAMDTVQAVLAKRGISIKNFVVAGGSKRGWTTWLTAAVDPRVKAIVPISIDMLDLASQFTHHWEAYGFYAPAIQPYVAFDLPCRMQSKRGRDLLALVDPIHYQDRLTLPKYLINSAGDQFFLPDSSHFYFDALGAPRSLRYTFNTDHFQEAGPAEVESLIASALLWTDDVNRGRESPAYHWWTDTTGALWVKASTPTPDEAFLWQASNPEARDFRLETIGATWNRSRLAPVGEGLYVADVATPTRGFTAYAVELHYPREIIGYSSGQVFTTDVHIKPDVLPYQGTACRAERPASLDSPKPGEILSGSVVVAGWACGAQSVDLEVNGQWVFETPYGYSRPDTEAVCGRTDTGFVRTFDLGNTAPGTYRLRLLVNGREARSLEVQIASPLIPNPSPKERREKKPLALWERGWGEGRKFLNF
ncbi:hypothetical protein CCP4SC76_2920004 [Gammaproteobacteria bacterium]